MAADIFNVRDEGFTVLAEGKDPITESVPESNHQTERYFAEPFLIVSFSSTASKAIPRRHGNMGQPLFPNLRLAILSNPK
jgi:hypothetical protein